MARYKPTDMSPKLITVDFARQILPGSFEYALCYLIDHEMDLAEFDHRFCNDEGGAPAYAPALVLKIVLLAYSRGLVSARAIESACQQKVLVRAVCGGATPHFTTLAAFVRYRGRGPQSALSPRADGLRPPRPDRAAALGDRWCEAARQCRQGQKRHAQGVAVRSEEDEPRRAEDVGTASPKGPYPHV